MFVRSIDGIVTHTETITRVPAYGPSLDYPTGSQNPLLWDYTPLGVPTLLQIFLPLRAPKVTRSAE